MTTKKVTLNLIGIDGNAFAVMGVFRRQARKEGWSSEEIDSVLKEAMSVDYNHLLATIDSHCECEYDEFEFDDEEDDDEEDN